MRETRTTEFKEKIANTFKKIASAFSNYIRLVTVLLRSPIIHWNCRIKTER